MGTKYQPDRQGFNKRGLPEFSKVAEGVELILQGMGYYIEGDLEKTPYRVAKAYMELCNNEPFELTEFETGDYDGIVFQGPIEFNSLCRHHILPFTGNAWVAYLPNKKIVGLSKIARTVDYWSRGLQTQEYITQNIANFLMDKLNPKGVAVRMTANHTCMELRGVKKRAPTTTQTVLGVFRKSPSTKQEFENFVRDNQ